MNGVTRRALLAGICSMAGMASAGTEDFPVTMLTDPITKRSIRHYTSPCNEVHHYYFISPWSPDGKKLVFFQFNRNVEKLTARGRFPGTLVLMNTDGSGRHSVTPELLGNYHTGANQFWGPTNDSVYFTDTSKPPGRLAELNLVTSKITYPETPVRCDRLSPNGKVMSCGGAAEWGLFSPAENRYSQLVTLERVPALSPNKALGQGIASQLQNTRFSPSGDRVMIVHRTVDDPPRMIEIYVYDLASKQLTYLTQSLHHPCWRPDGKAILFVRWDDRRKMQNLWEIDVVTKAERCIFDRHISVVHSSYHPRNQRLVLADSYGGDFGNGLVLIDIAAGKARQLVTIPQGAGADPVADERFPFRNFGLWMPPRKYLNEPRPVWSADGSRVLYTSQESGRINLYVVDTSDLAPV